MKAILSLLLVLATTSVFALDRGSILAKPQPITQLLIESEKLKVLQEDSVQREEFQSRRLYGVTYSNLSASQLSVFANNRTVNYPTGAHPAVGFNIGYFPVYFVRGYFGILGHINYSYMEREGVVKTSLHWVNTVASLAYRYEPSLNSWVKPFAAIGGGTHVVVQRGPSYYNTSEAQGEMVGTLGVNLNLTRALRLKSPLMWELNTSYQRHAARSDGKLDFSGDQFAVGLEVAL